MKSSFGHQSCLAAAVETVAGCAARRSTQHAVIRRIDPGARRAAMRGERLIVNSGTRPQARWALDSGGEK